MGSSNSMRETSASCCCMANLASAAEVFSCWLSSFLTPPAAYDVQCASISVCFSGECCDPFPSPNARSFNVNEVHKEFPEVVSECRCAEMPDSIDGLFMLMAVETLVTAPLPEDALGGLGGSGG